MNALVSCSIVRKIKPDTHARRHAYQTIQECNPQADFQNTSVAYCTTSQNNTTNFIFIDKRLLHRITETFDTYDAL